jgi:hypothetical protein
MSVPLCASKYMHLNKRWFCCAVLQNRRVDWLMRWALEKVLAKFEKYTGQEYVGLRTFSSRRARSISSRKTLVRYYYVVENFRKEGHLRVVGFARTST